MCEQSLSSLKDTKGNGFPHTFLSVSNLMVVKWFPRVNYYSTTVHCDPCEFEDSLGDNVSKKTKVI